MHNHQPSISLVIFSDCGFIHWQEFLSSLTDVLEKLDLTYEMLIVNYGLSELSLPQSKKKLVSVIYDSKASYGVLLRNAIQESRGEYVITIEAERSISMDFLYDLWNARHLGEIVIGSRYIKGGSAKLPVFRKITSRLSNLIFSRGLDLHIQDVSSAFRLYNRRALRNITTECTDFDILQEILVKALMMGYQIVEIPFRYRSENAAYGRVTQFALAYLRTFIILWKQRNSIASGDYDTRAYDALMPPQRYWQRQRYKLINSLIQKSGRQKCLDVGCGSSRIISILPAGSVALDILMQKLRYAKKFGCLMVQGSIFTLPITNESFPCVLCSQVIEHVPRANVFEELDRVLEPGGFLILGTPDYGKWEWRVIERLYKLLLPQAYADDHITHYTYQELIHSFVNERGYRLESKQYILNGELILGLRKPRF